MTDDTKELWAGFLGSLMFDVQDALKRQQMEDEPTNRRSLIRALIAAVEGLAWIYREHVVDIANTIDALTDTERAALADTAATVDDTGRISTQKRYLSTTAMIRLTTRIAKKFAPDCAPDFGGTGWANLKATIALRNRIAHPKQQEDLEISDDDVARGILAFDWFIDVVIAVMAQSNDAFRDHVREVGEIADLLKAGDHKMLELYRQASGDPLREA